MRRDHPPIGKRPVDGSQLPGDIFVGQSMKSIAADSLLMQRAGEREPRGDLGLVVVKRGIETGDLGKVWRHDCNCVDRGQIVRLMERCERAKRVEFVEKARIDRSEEHTSELQALMRTSED